MKESEDVRGSKRQGGGAGEGDERREAESGSAVEGSGLRISRRPKGANRQDAFNGKWKLRTWERSYPTPRNALSVRWFVGHVFYAHLMRLLYFSNLTNCISPKILSVFLTTARRSHGLSARRARRTKSSRPEGPLTRSWGPEGP